MKHVFLLTSSNVQTDSSSARAAVVCFLVCLFLVSPSSAVNVAPGHWLFSVDVLETSHQLSSGPNRTQRQRAPGPGRDIKTLNLKEDDGLFLSDILISNSLLHFSDVLKHLFKRP